MPLEPRIMYDGAAAASAAAAHHHEVHHDPGLSGGPDGPVGPPTSPTIYGSPWQKQSTAAAPMPAVTSIQAYAGKGDRDATPTTSATGDAPGQQVVFIDSQVPDLQDLLSGVKPGELVFVLNSNQDGLQQIADILASHDLTNLSAISIVGHGQQGEFTLGSTNLTDANLASETQPLAAIGQALAPGGDILLYGCDTAQGATGQQFISDFSAYAGGHSVAASTQDIGTLQGTNGGFDNWTLDASTGPIDASVPFTAQALANYEGLLSGTTVTASSITTTLTVDADHDGGISPGDTVTSAVTITNTTGTAATGVTLNETLSGLTAVANSVEITPIGVADSYSLVGNTPITENAANGVLANDIDFNGDTLTVSKVNGSAADVGTATAITDGTLTLNSNGSFTFTPTTGFSGTTSFTYTAHDAAGDSDQTATVTLTVTAPVWYVDSAASSSGADGSYNHPFETIAAAVSAAATDTSSGVNNIIFVENAGATYTATSGITLASGEELLGDGSSLTSVNGNTVGLSSVNPTFSVSSGNAVTLNSGNTISGINITDTGSGDGIVDDGSSVGTLTLSSIAVTTGSGTGISLTDGGTVTASGTNTINASTGTALDVENTDIGSGDLIFKSISSGTGGSAANNGITLIDTGSAGGLIVTGDGNATQGGDGSGGTIESKTGSDDSTTSGDGIFLESTDDVQLDDMHFGPAGSNNTSTITFANFAIFGEHVNNFILENSTLNGVSGTHLDNGGAPSNEGTIAFGVQPDFAQPTVNGLTGSATITNSIIGNGFTNVLYVYDNSGTLNELNVTGNTLGGNNDVNGSAGNDEVNIEADGTSAIDANISNNSFTATVGNGLNMLVLSSADANLIADTNTFSNSDSFQLSGSNHLNLDDDSTIGTVTFDISGNHMDTGSTSAALAVVLNTNSGGNLSGTINDNTIGTSTSDTGGFDGIDVNNEGTTGTITVSVTNNTLDNFQEFGLSLLVSNVGPVTNATITGNTFLPDSDNDITSDLTVSGGDLNVQIGSATNSALKNTFSNSTNTNDFLAEVNIFPLNSGSYVDISQAGSTSTNATTVITNDNTFNGTPNILTTAPGGAKINVVAAAPTAPSLSPTLTTPSINGAAQEGDTLSVGTVAAGNDGSSITYQWEENFGDGYVDIAGATGTSYTLQESDIGATLEVIATSTTAHGVGLQAVSSATSAVTDHLTLTTPTISGTDTVGQILTASTPTVDNADATITYQWEANSGSGFAAISGATGQTLRLTSALAGDTIEVIATATDPHGGDISETSPATSLANNGSATVAGFTVPSLPTVTIGTLPGDDAVTVSWEATVNAQSDQLIVNPSYTGSVTGSNFTTATANGTVTLDTLSLEGEIFDDANDSGMASGQSGISGVSLSRCSPRAAARRSRPSSRTAAATTTLPASPPETISCRSTPAISRPRTRWRITAIRRRSATPRPTIISAAGATAWRCRAASSTPIPSPSPTMRRNRPAPRPIRATTPSPRSTSAWSKGRKLPTPAIRSTSTRASARRRSIMPSR